MHPLKRIGEAEEVAAAIAFMLDPANSWITAGLCKFNPVDPQRLKAAWF
jgi:NAD(P)-dependent dehydrogenase (short-subunit alcohol dehydrogenase family)